MEDDLGKRCVGLRSERARLVLETPIRESSRFRRSVACRALAFLPSERERNNVTLPYSWLGYWLP